MSEQSISHKFAQHPAYGIQDLPAEPRQDSHTQDLRVDPLSDLLSGNLKQQASATSFSWQDITKALGGSDGFPHSTRKETQVLKAYAHNEFAIEEPEAQTAYQPAEQAIETTAYHPIEATYQTVQVTETTAYDPIEAPTSTEQVAEATDYQPIEIAHPTTFFSSIEATPSDNMHLYGDSLLKYWLSTDSNTKQYWPKPLYSPQCSFSKVFLADGTQCDVQEAPDNTRHEITRYPDRTLSERVTDPFGRPVYQSKMQDGQWQIQVLSYNDLNGKPSPFLSSKRTITSEGNITNIIYGKHGAIASSGSEVEEYIG
jgi:hypothetical protein